MRDMDAEILVYEGFDELDAIGPFEVLSLLAPKLVTLKRTDTVTASHAFSCPRAADRSGRRLGGAQRKDRRLRRVPSR